MGIDDMKPADWKVAGEPWESLLTKWVCHGGDGGYKCRPDWDTLLKILATEGYGELSQRISSFLSGKYWGRLINEFEQHISLQ